MEKKIFIFAVLLAVGVGTPTSTQAQGSFQNLDFESANVPTLPLGQIGAVSVADGIPGWSAYVAGKDPGFLLYNAVDLGSGSVALFGPHSDPYYIINGNYSVILHDGMFGPTAIGQTGTVPLGSQSLLFKVSAWSSPFEVTFAGQPLSLSPISTESGRTVYSADIASFAGMTGELKFTCIFNPAHSTGMLLDDITFSKAPAVPEPTTLALALMGFSVLVGRRLFKLKK